MKSKPKKSIELFNKAEEGTKLNVTFHWVNFDQKLNCQSHKLYSNRIKTRQHKQWLDWSQEEKYSDQLVQQGSMRFLLTLMNRCCNDVKLVLTVCKIIVLNSSSMIKKQYNRYIFFILMV